MEQKKLKSDKTFITSAIKTGLEYENRSDNKTLRLQVKDI